MGELGDFFKNLFRSGDWPARWNCGKWSEFHGWLYIISDILIFAAYFTIPFLLINFIIRKKNVPFPKIFWLFGMFIFACGATHLIDAFMFWVPAYRVSALMRFFTAVVSWATIFALYRVLPAAFSLKTPHELERIVEQRTNELQDSIQRSKFIADAMPQMVWTARADGGVDYVNSQAVKYTGLPESALMEWGWKQLVHPDDLDRFLDAWQMAMNNVSTLQMECRLRDAHGNYHWFLSRANPYYDENGNLLLWIGTATEIEQHKREAGTLEKKIQERTEQLREANRKLAQSNSDLENFAAVASHDLQAPLRTITTYLSMLEERNEALLDEQSKKYISRSVDVSGRMRNLIENLLTYSKLNAEAVNLEEVDLNEVMGSVMANLDDLIEMRNAEISCDELPTITADLTQMEQLFQNLVANGINYNDSVVPKIGIRYTDDGAFHRISVSDNGVGIEPEYIKKVFDVFVRLDAVRKGTGLGLAICQRIVANHGGEISAESEKGLGTTFTFTLAKDLVS